MSITDKLINRIEQDSDPIKARMEMFMKCLFQFTGKPFTNVEYNELKEMLLSLGFVQVAYNESEGIINAESAHCALTASIRDL